ncbi:MAG: SIR2 family protein [Anaerolineales bacterium]|nr:SIR2 family protein [Anaerolineales bacterium]
MKQRKAGIITALDELIPLLGDSFIVFFGSAVSGKLSPRAPMVTEVKDYILELAATRMEDGSKADKLAAQYVGKLLATKPYRSILDTTKFETFIGKLSRYVGKNAVDDLIARLYTCEAEEYGPNHSALGYLLKKRVCLAALTTNFDNALELAYPKLKILDYKTSPARLPSRKEPPILIKLHGDAISKSGIATSREIFGATLQKHFSFLKDLLDGQKVLVVGYSGNGDIDISAHLARTQAQFFWCDYNLTGGKLPINDNLTRVLCDLSYIEGKPTLAPINAAGKFIQKLNLKNFNFGQFARDNLLIRIAEYHGWSGKRVGENISWRDGVRDWMSERKPSELTRFTVSLLSWHTDLPHMHIAYYRTTTSKRPNSSIDYADALTQFKAYHSAVNCLEKITKENSKKSLPSIEAVKLLGYNFWRMGKFEDALLVLSNLINPKFWHGFRVEARSHISDAARNYLETLIELFYRASSKSDYNYALKFALSDEVLNKIVMLENQSVGNEYLLRCVIFEIKYAIDRKISNEEIRSLFNEAFSMEEWPAAAVISRFWLLVNWREAIIPWCQTTQVLWKRRKLDLIIQNLASLAYSIFRTGIVYRILYNHQWIRIRTWRREKTLKQKQKEWLVELNLDGK